MFNAPLKEGQRQENIRKEGDIDIHRDNKNPRDDRGDFIDYEEVE